MSNELAQFIGSWDQEAQNTIKLLRALPADQYDFRPDREGRSLGECAWHLAEVDAFISDGVASGAFDFNKKLPGLERPRNTAELATGYERVHKACVERIKAMKPEDLNRMIPFMGHDMRAGDLLWFVLLHHAVHHRGQLVLLTRLAGGKPPGMYGPTREDMAAMQAAKGN
jgi:uncharacterized damage-inducible protein DinB